MKNSVKIPITALLLAPALSFGTIQPCNTCPEVLLPEITYAQISDAIISGNYDYALSLTYDYALQELRKRLNDPKKVAVAYEKIRKQLEAVLTDSTKTDRQKGEEISRLIDESLLPYTSERTGDLQVSLRHSIDFGTTRLTWDNKIEVDKCSGGQLNVCLQWDGGTCAGWTLETWYTYVRRVPDYYIYRIINGQEKLITKLKGSQEEHRESITFSPSIYETLKSLVTVDYNYSPDVDQSRAVFYDVQSDLRDKGTTLQYRIVADNGPYQDGSCGSTERYDTTVSADTDGDGRVDFVPAQVYAEYWGKAYGWIAPVLMTILE